MIPKSILEIAHKSSWTLDGIHVGDPRSGIDVYITKVDDMQIVMCLGSEWKITDWVTNFSFLLKPPYADPKTKVRAHGGYLRGWERIRKTVLEHVFSDKVLVTGFSMGGGVSNLVAVDIEYNKKPSELYCVNFAGPRIWNKAGMESYNKRVPNTEWYVYGNDIVPKIPPMYRAGGQKIHFGEKESWYKASVKDHLEFYSAFAIYLKGHS